MKKDEQVQQNKAIGVTLKHSGWRAGKAEGKSEQQHVRGSSGESPQTSNDPLHTGFFRNMLHTDHLKYLSKNHK